MSSTFLRKLWLHCVAIYLNKKFPLLQAIETTLFFYTLILAY